MKTIDARTHADDVCVTRGLLVLVDMLRKARDFYRQEADIALYSGLEEPADSLLRVEALLGQYAIFAHRVGISVNRVTVQALLNYPIPVCVLSLSCEELTEKWVFNPWTGWRKR